MTLSVKISVNGNHKTTYTVNGGEPIAITGKGSDGPKVVDVSFDHSKPIDIHIEPDQPDVDAPADNTDEAGTDGTEDGDADNGVEAADNAEGSR